MHARLVMLVLAMGSLGACSSAHPAPAESGPPIIRPPATDARSGPPGPQFGTTVSLAEAPPALGAATLVITDDGRTAIATDPDRDRVLLVDLETRTVKTVTLPRGSLPGRVIEDGVRAHVVLRGSGAVASIDLTTAQIVTETPVCPAPRGIAKRITQLYVACAGGEIVMVDTEGASGGSGTMLLGRYDRDLRDIVIANDRIVVTRFRSAEVLTLRLDGTLVSRRAPAPFNIGRPQRMRAPSVAWRMVKTGDMVRVVHQEARQSMISTESPGAYAAAEPCDGLTLSATSSFGIGTSEDGAVGPAFADAVLPIDLAVTRDGSRYAIIAAGNGHTPELPQVHLSRPATDNCMRQPSSQLLEANGGRRANTDPPGQHVAVAFLPDNQLAILSREPAALHIRALDETRVKWTTIPLGGESREDTGHAILHANTGGGIACASCHPEGGEDGLAWFLDSERRRTQSLRRLDGTGPYHWRGEIPDLTTLATAAFTERMNGPALAPSQIGALASWMIRLPTLPISPAIDAQAVVRGKALFEGSETKCASCHSGTRLTNNMTVDVGTGGSFRVPSLIGLAERAPYMHNGCATTLLDRFGPCGGAAHGGTAFLSTQEKADLVTYLESL